MEFQEMQAEARAVRDAYAAREIAQYGRSWSHEELMLGFLGDVGDLAKLVQGKAGVRPRADLDEALAHELADCLWSVMSLADAYGVDLQSAFGRTMAELRTYLEGDAQSRNVSI
ncbi:MazG nucleotide pyrophosphohydrolase domain-containing protein [Cellulomonas sp. Leaf334]|uniref:MazG nucleotide pyrophosphohydrolase domain-containing protein n=1 Tax=Cellulomonas sp. Leaf334 TaxID=1736339 RepID=UPI001F20D825|nr:MazG nucleotide pyrophosphohydrolase domain-containing protein [Cellulomonas sp. Leaf334]